MSIRTASIFLAFIACVFTANFAYASTLPGQTTKQQSASFRQFKTISVPPVLVPTVVEVAFTDDVERYEVAILDTSTDTFQPYYFQQVFSVNETPVMITTNPRTSDSNALIDGNPATYADFYLPETAQGRVTIDMVSRDPVTSSSVTLLLANNVALPTSVSISAKIDGQDRTIVATKSMSQQTIRFPQTTSDHWQIVLTYAQPLRIGDVRLNQDNVTRSASRAVRFLAQPGHTYEMYYDADRFSSISVGESGALEVAKDVVKGTLGAAMMNPNYVIADSDSDSIPDILDNCVSEANKDQVDVNQNGRGDACDDFDQDGLTNSHDNCINEPNRDQKDVDGDGIGDVCDPQESRLTEQYPWIPWVGIGFAALVLITLFAMTASATFRRPDSTISKDTLPPTQPGV